MSSPSQADATLWFESALLPAGWAADVRIGIAGGMIARVETGVPAGPADERHFAAVPGLPNLHSHAFQRGMAGLAEQRGPAADSFWSWRTVMYRFVDRLGPDDIEAIAALAFIEMLESGFTQVAEFHYLHHDPAGRTYDDIAETAGRLAAAAGASGIGLTLLPVFYAHAGFGGMAPGAGQRRFINDVDQFGRLLESAAAAIAPLEGAVLGIAPHSLRAVTLGELADIIPLAGSGPVHIHIAEQTREVEDCLAWCGRRPVELLFETAAVDTRWCLVHATHMTAAETALLAASGAVAGLCPITEANLGDGLFPAQEFLRQGGRFGVGSDSNVLIDAAAELRQLEYGERLRAKARNVLAPGPGMSTGRRLFEGAVAGGAAACGIAGSGLRPGAAADIVALNGAHACFVGRGGDALLDSWIFAARAGAIGSVWRRGVRVVVDGRHVGREAIARRYARVLQRVLASES